MTDDIGPEWPDDLRVNASITLLIAGCFPFFSG
jgi:hypothetical protein